MKRLSATLLLLALLLNAGAQDRVFAANAYLSPGATGNCSSSSTPCSNLSDALAYVQDTRGEIFCLAPGAFGDTATIQYEITINCVRGVVANLTINIPTSRPSAVKVRGLEVNPAVCSTVLCSGGLAIQSAKTVVLEDVAILGTRRNPTNPGSPAGPAVLDARPGPSKLVIRNSSVSGNDGAGIVIAPQSGVIDAVLENISAANNTYGLAVGSGGRVTAERSAFSGNTVAGVEGDGGSQITVTSSVISSNNIGVQSNGSVRLKNNDINFNATLNDGPAASLGGNSFSGNGSTGTTLTMVPGSPSDIGP